MWQRFKNLYHFAIALISNFKNGFPSRKLKVIGVTGTDGKTTTVYLIFHILSFVGYNTSMISSVGARIDGKDYDVGFHVTTPSSWQLQAFIKKIKDLITNSSQKNFLVLEVTSHALDQKRTWGINYEIGVITNVTNEHLDYHKTYENYVNTKAKLFKNAKKIVLNKDDKSFEIIKKLDYVKNKKIITYSLNLKADFNLKSTDFKAKITGDFNKYNILAAYAVCKELGIDESLIKKAINIFELPIGRMERVYKKEFSIIVDFAHTPNALKNALSVVSKETKGRVIHVFGSAGERDTEKRSEMGKMSSLFSDIIILTAEDPRSESVDMINSEIEKGLKKHFKLVNTKNYQDNRKNKNIYFKINDRKEAINFAVSIAKKGDVIITTGKSHEKSMNYGKGEEPWNEYEAVKNAIKNKAVDKE